MHIPVRAPRTTRPLSAPPGFRRARHNSCVGRGFSRGVRLAGLSITARLAGLRAVFDDLDGAVRRMLQHLRPRRRVVGFVLVAAIVERGRGVAFVAPRGADTS